MVEHEASDLYLTGDAPPIYRIHGATKPTDAPPFNNDEQLEALALVLLRGQQRGDRRNDGDEPGPLLQGTGRFRVNISRQRGNVGLVFRHIKVEIQTVVQLQLPPIIQDIAMTKRGPVLVGGAINPPRWPP